MFRLMIGYLIVAFLVGCAAAPPKTPQISAKFLLKKKAGIKILERHQKGGMEILPL